MRRLLYAAFILVGTVTACGRVPGPTSPAPRADPTTSMTPVPAPSASLAALAPSADLRIVAVDGVKIGDAPAGADPFAAVPSRLAVGEEVWVIDTAEAAAGLAALVVVDRPVLEYMLPMGWIPLETDGVPTLAETDRPCPPHPTAVSDLDLLGRLGRLACFGGRVVTIEAFAPVGCGIGGSSRVGEPEWLNGTWSGLTLGDAEPNPPDFEVEVALRARIAPGADVPDCGEAGWYRFTGHFDDPASATCRTTDQTPAGAPVVIDERLSELLCRSEFVLERAAPIAPRP